MKQKLFVAAILIATFVPLMMVTQAWTYTAAADVNAKEIFVAKCGNCHSLASAGIEAKAKSEKMRGPDLGKLQIDAATLTSYLKKETALDGREHKIAFKGSDEELQALVDWLLEQKAQ